MPKVKQVSPHFSGSFAVAQGVIQIGQHVAKGIDLANRRKPGNLGRWVKEKALEIFEQHGRQYNVVVIRENHLARDWRQNCNIVETKHIECRGSDIGNDWGSIGYRAIVLKNGGYVKNCGDGGYINWCFYGGRKDGNVARF